MRTIYFGPKDRAKMHKVDVYDATFEVVLCHSIDKARNSPARVGRLGGTCNCKDCAGLCASERSKLSVFFTRADLKAMGHSLVAHEVFHATHRILEWAGIKLTPRAHEAHAHLMGALTKIVYQDLKKWKSTPCV